MSLATLILAALSGVEAAGMYSKTSPVLKVDSSSYASLIANSNYTSMVEFYAPWCGHCRNLKPAYEKAAEALNGLAKVAAIDCDEDANKQFCGSMGVQGFPTLKIIRPGKKPGKPAVEDYNGPRTASGIANGVKNSINNFVTKLTDDNLDQFLAGDKPRAILFTEKGTTSALLRSIAIDFLDVISIGQVRSKETGAVKKFSIDTFPSFVLQIGPSDETISYQGDFNKKDMVDFLRQVGEPNPDPAPAKAKKDGKPKKAQKGASPNEPKQATGSDGAAPEPEKAPESDAAHATSRIVEPSIIPIAAISKEGELAELCLQPTSQTCLLAFVPVGPSDAGVAVVSSLAQLNTKYIQGKRHVFRFYTVPEKVDGHSLLRSALDLKQDVELFAINVRRSWWSHYKGEFRVADIESWIDALRMGEGGRLALPKDDVLSVAQGAVAQDATESKSATSEPVAGTAPEEEEETAAPEEKAGHQEL